MSMNLDSRFCRVRSHRTLSWVLLLTSGIAWGATFSLAKIAVRGGVHPLSISLWQAGLGAIFAGTYLLSKQKGLSFRPDLIRYYLFCGLVGTALPLVLFMSAARHVPAGILSLTAAMVPIFTLILALLLNMEKADRWKFAGIAAGAAAAAMIFLPRSSLGTSISALWMLAAIVGTICYAVENIYISKAMPDATERFDALLGVFSVSFAAILGLSLVLDVYFVPTFPFTGVEWAVVLNGIIHTIAYGVLVYLITSAGPVFASQTAYVVTLSGVVWGILIFDERNSVWIWLALALLLFGISLVRPKE